jgi:MoxR-like ATPase
MATQNPIEMEGTYTLPEAQLDRFFFKLLVEFPTGDNLATILDRTTKREMPHGERVMDADLLTQWAGLVRDVPTAPQITDYVVRLVSATHPEHADAPEIVKQYVRFGSSPRGAQTLLLGGKVNALRSARFNVSFQDIQKAARPALRHRVLLNFEAEADAVEPDQVVDAIVQAVDTKAKVA